MVKNLLSNKESIIAILDTKPIPICELTRIKRCKKVKGKIYKGNNGNRERFEYKLRLIIDTYEQPISFNIMPAPKHDINALKKITVDLLNEKPRYSYLKVAKISRDICKAENNGSVHQSV